MYLKPSPHFLDILHLKGALVPLERFDSVSYN